MKKNNCPTNFPGFPPEPSINFWSYPKVMDGYWHLLTGSEQKVLDFILRHTWGFGKTEDEISLSQMEHGINGFDKGTGLSHQAVITATKGLVNKGFVNKNKGGKANCYGLIKNLAFSSQNYGLAASQNSIHTIKDITINNRQYSPRKKRPYFRGQLMVKVGGVWKVIPGEGGSWLEYAGKESEIEWK
jgi:hypothetical protein